MEKLTLLLLSVLLCGSVEGQNLLPIGTASNQEVSDLLKIRENLFKNLILISVDPELSAESKDDLRLNLFDSTGRFMQQVPAQGSFRFLLDCRSLPDGKYFVRLSAGKQTLITRPIQLKTGNSYCR